MNPPAGVAAVEAPPPTDVRTQIALGFAALLIGLGGFFTWAALAPLDEGIPVSGVVAVQTHRKQVQHLTGGLVEQILVSEGQRVAAGQNLLVLDTRQQRGQQAVAERQLSGLQAQLRGLQARLPERERQLQSLQAQASALQPLVAEDLYPRNQFAALQREQARLQADLIAERAAVTAAREQIAELEARRAVLQTEIDRAVITAPVSGTVMNLAAHTVGGVIAPGVSILELVPDADALVISAQVPTHLVEQVRTGLPAQLRFVALDARRTPVVEGRVALVSADRVTNPQTQQAYYTAQVSVPDAALDSLGRVRVTPGMPVEVILITGERTFLDYLTKPLLDGFARGLKER